MHTIDKIYNAQIDIKKSNFLSYLCPFSAFKELHESLKKDHPKAVHVVYAYRYLNQYGQIVENQSDDGEPKGTSGMPALNALRGARLIESGVLIVRYFGGIKLGTGGLVRAYGQATNLVIDSSNLIVFEQKEKIIFYTPFSLLSRLEYFLSKEFNCDYNRNFTENGAVWTVFLKEEEMKIFVNFVDDLYIFGFEFYALPIFSKNIILNKI